MNRKVKLFILIIPIVAQLGCGVMHISYNRVNPPEIEINAIAAPTLVLYRFDTGKWDFNQKKKIEVYRNAFNTFDEALKESLNKLQFFDVSYDTTLHAIMWKSPDQKIDQDSKWIHKIAMDKNYEFYILVNHFNISRHYDTETEKYEDGTKSKTAIYYLHAYASIDIWSKNGVLIGETKLHENIMIDERTVFSGLLAIGPSVGNYGEQANEISYALGFKYYQKFFTQQEIVDSYYYTDKELAELQPLMETQNWQEAQTKLLTMFPVANNKMAEHIAHNLAIIYEILGDFDQANIWRQRSNQ